MTKAITLIVTPKNNFFAVFACMFRMKVNGNSYQHIPQIALLDFGGVHKNRVREATFSKNRPLADSFIESQCPFWICLSVPFHVLDFEAYFAPISRNQMSEIFRDSESLGKSPGKKWSQN